MTHKIKTKELTNDIIDPEILETIKQKANEGNIQASKLLIEYKKLKNARDLSEANKPINFNELTTEQRIKLQRKIQALIDEIKEEEPRHKRTVT